MQLRCDWESAEEIVGTALRRVRRRSEGAACTRMSSPACSCSGAMLCSSPQLLDNLVDNALKYSAADAPVELLVHRAGPTRCWPCATAGPASSQAFGSASLKSSSAAMSARRARAPGLASASRVCRAIAEAHAGSLRLRPRGHGGTAFEFRLPLREVPAMEDL